MDLVRHGRIDGRGVSGVWRAVAAAAVLGAVPLRAQSPRPRARVEVLVRSAIDSTAVPHAGVELDGGASLVADSLGRLVLHAVTTGPHVIVIRRPGFAPDTLRATIEDGGPVALTAWLRPVARQLADVVVAAPRTVQAEREARIAERARRNEGTLFTPARIDSLNPSRTRDLLAAVNGVYVNDRSITFVRCQTSATLPGPFGSSGGAPRVQVYVDGMRLTVNGRTAEEVLSSVDPRSIAAMEVYDGTARIPAEYLEDACAVVAIWTR